MGLSVPAFLLPLVSSNYCPQRTLLIWQHQRSGGWISFLRMTRAACPGYHWAGQTAAPPLAGCLSHRPTNTDGPASKGCPRTAPHVSRRGQLPAGAVSPLEVKEGPPPAPGPWLRRPGLPHPGPWLCESCAAHGGACGPGFLLTLTAAMDLHANTCPVLFALTSFP